MHTDSIDFFPSKLQHTRPQIPSCQTIVVTNFKAMIRFLGGIACNGGEMAEAETVYLTEMGSARPENSSSPLYTTR